MGNSRVKSRYLAEVSITEFFRRNFKTWFWTFTEPGRAEGEPVWTKDQAEAHFKPFVDLCARRGLELLVVWERQKRGAWHPHCLINGYLDVNWLRPWMVARGWGPIMRVEFLAGSNPQYLSGEWVRFKDPVRDKVMRYLTKYLTKGFVEPDTEKKKRWGAHGAGTKAGNTSFKWAPWEKAGAYLWAMGRELFKAIEGRIPEFRDLGRVIRYGVEESDWEKIDPLWEFALAP